MRPISTCSCLPRRDCARLAGDSEVRSVERLEQYKQPKVRGAVQHFHELLERHHAHDQQYAGCAVQTRFEYLVAVDQEILAHRRHGKR